jgi:integrase
MAVSIEKKTGKLVIRFACDGRQFYLSTGLKDNKQNRAIAEARWELIQREIALGEFDQSLVRYKFKPKGPKEIKKCNLKELWEKFTQYQKNHLEQTTILNRYATIAKYIDKLPYHDLAEAVKIRDYLLSSTTSSMAISLIAAFSQACEWGIKSGLIPDNPFKDLRIKTRRKAQTDIKAFTTLQRDLIISEFESAKPFYAPLIKFLFYSGCRHGEAFALCWDDIDNECSQIKITKSKNFYRVLKGTKNGKNRILSISKGSKLQNLMLEIRPLKRKGLLIFTDTAGAAMDSFKLMRLWNGQAPGKYEYPGVVRILADKGRVPYLSPYSTRHTFATLAIAQGISPEKVAYWLGDNVATVLKYYCHPEVTRTEVPDF